MRFKGFKFKSTLLTVNKQSPLILESTISYNWILCPTDQILSIVLHSRHVTQHASRDVRTIYKLRRTQNLSSRFTCLANTKIRRGRCRFKNVLLTFLAICLTWWFPFHQVITASGREPELAHSIS